jgi:hypothetical protein
MPHDNYNGQHHDGVDMVTYYRQTSRWTDDTWSIAMLQAQHLYDLLSSLTSSTRGLSLPSNQTLTSSYSMSSSLSNRSLRQLSSSASNRANIVLACISPIIPYCHSSSADDEHSV